MSLAFAARSARGLILCVFALLLCAAPASAALPQPVEQNIGALLDMALRRNSAINPDSYAALLDFVDKIQGDGRSLVPDRRIEANGSVLRMSMKTSLSRMMRYCYNPDIPNYLLFPSVLRMGGWNPGSDILDRDRKPWLHLGKLDKPVALWGSEYEVNAPDSFGGGYYRYDLNRLVILTRHHGKNVLISVSKQKDKSSVGKKAVILDEGEWSFFYSGINGLNKGMIGWADTFMYDSASVQVFVEESPNQTSVTLFKWLRAGWAGMNMVMKDHINEGSTRYANAFKRIMESDRLPEPDEFAQRVKELSTLPEGELDKKIQAYAAAIENIAKTSPAMNKSEYQKVVQGGSYAKILSREERVSAILVEYLKSRLGKKALVDFPAAARKG